jgi:outer membrane murein-binding lipoprotein Lpp
LLSSSAETLSAKVKAVHARVNAVREKKNRDVIGASFKKE